MGGGGVGPLTSSVYANARTSGLGIVRRRKIPTLPDARNCQTMHFVVIRMHNVSRL